MRRKENKPKKKKIAQTNKKKKAGEEICSCRDEIKEVKKLGEYGKEYGLK